MKNMDDLDRRLVDRLQAGFPLESRPFQVLAEELGSTEEEVLKRIQRLQDKGVIRRIGPVFELKRLGHVSTLCGARVAPGSVDAAAAIINSFPEVTHNYLRDNVFNLWFTIIAPDEPRVDAILDHIRAAPGVEYLMSLPAERMYKIQVRFQTEGDAE